MSLPAAMAVMPDKKYRFRAKTQRAFIAKFHAQYSVIQEIALIINLDASEHTN